MYLYYYGWMVIVLANSMLVFYLSFELLLYLMYGYLLHMQAHSRARHAVLHLVGYTVVGSAAMLIAFIIWYVDAGPLILTVEHRAFIAA